MVARRFDIFLWRVDSVFMVRKQHSNMPNRVVSHNAPIAVNVRIKAIFVFSALAAALT
jgi:hypothetical protein